MSFSRSNVIVTDDDEESNDYDVNNITYNTLNDHFEIKPSPPQTPSVSLNNQMNTSSPSSVASSVTPSVTPSVVKPKRPYHRKQKDSTETGSLEAKPRRGRPPVVASAVQQVSQVLPANMTPLSVQESQLSTLEARLFYLQQEMTLLQEQSRQERNKYMSTIEEQSKTINVLMQKCDTYQRTLTQLGIHALPTK